MRLTKISAKIPNKNKNKNIIFVDIFVGLLLFYYVKQQTKLSVLSTVLFKPQNNEDCPKIVKILSGL